MPGPGATDVYNFPLYEAVPKPNDGAAFFTGEFIESYAPGPGTLAAAAFL